MFSEISSDQHQHDEGKNCLGCIVSETLGIFAERGIDPVTAIGILDIVRHRLIGSIIIDMDPHEDDEPEDEDG